MLPETRMSAGLRDIHKEREEHVVREEIIPHGVVEISLEDQIKNHLHNQRDHHSVNE